MSRYNKTVRKAYDDEVISQAKADGMLASEILWRFLRNRAKMRELTKVADFSGYPNESLSQIIYRHGACRIATAEDIFASVGYRLTVERIP